MVCVDDDIMTDGFLSGFSIICVCSLGHPYLWPSNPQLSLVTYFYWHPPLLFISYISVHFLRLAIWDWYELRNNTKNAHSTIVQECFQKHLCFCNQYLVQCISYSTSIWFHFSSTPSCPLASGKKGFPETLNFVTSNRMTSWHSWYFSQPIL